jgi:hypothetical protein
LFNLHNHPFITPEYPPVRWKSVHWTLVIVNYSQTIFRTHGTVFFLMIISSGRYCRPTAQGTRGEGLSWHVQRRGRLYGLYFALFSKQRY